MDTRKKLLIVISLLIVGMIIITSAYVILEINPKNEVTENNPVSIDAIEQYGYTLENRDTALYKSIFEELKSCLNKSEVDDEEYAKLVAKLYAVDLYTINNKVTKYDVGGVDFVYPEIKENYELNVRDTIYKYVEDDSYNSREQELPEVKTVSIDDMIKTTYTLNEEKIDAYLIKMSLEYVKDLGYDAHLELTLIKYDNKYYVVKSDVK